MKLIEENNSYDLVMLNLIIISLCIRRIEKFLN